MRLTRNEVFENSAGASSAEFCRSASTNMRVIAKQKEVQKSTVQDYILNGAKFFYLKYLTADSNILRSKFPSTFL